MYQTKKALDLLIQQIDASIKQIEEDLGANLLSLTRSTAINVGLSQVYSQLAETLQT